MIYVSNIAVLAFNVNVEHVCTEFLFLVVNAILCELTQFVS